MRRTDENRASGSAACSSTVPPPSVAAPSARGGIAGHSRALRFRGLRPEFYRVPAAANVSDAVWGRRLVEGWTRVRAPVDEVF